MGAGDDSLALLLDEAPAADFLRAADPVRAVLRPRAVVVDLRAVLLLAPDRFAAVLFPPRLAACFDGALRALDLRAPPPAEVLRAVVFRPVDLRPALLVPAALRPPRPAERLLALPRAAAVLVFLRVLLAELLRVDLRPVVLRPPRLDVAFLAMRCSSCFPHALPLHHFEQ